MSVVVLGRGACSGEEDSLFPTHPALSLGSDPLSHIPPELRAVVSGREGPADPQSQSLCHAAPNRRDLGAPFFPSVYCTPHLSRDRARVWRLAKESVEKKREGKRTVDGAG